MTRINLLQNSTMGNDISRGPNTEIVRKRDYMLIATIPVDARK